MPRAPAPHRFPDRLRLPLRFDADRLAADLDNLRAVDWTAHFVPQNYEGDWSAIALRAPAGETHPIRLIYSDPSATDFVDTAALRAAPHLQEVLASLKCPLRAVRLMRLTPGSIIKDHCDHDLAAEFGMARLHVPITTNADVDFRLNGKRVEMAPGSLWYLRLSDHHSVANRGATDRVHLVIDVGVNDWLVAQLERAATPAEPA